MKNLVLLIALLFSISLAHAQVAIIQDKDGYTNVREKPNGQSKIIHKINSNEAIWYNYEIGVDTFEWVPVYIPRNVYSDYSINSTEPTDIVGFIHISRLQPLEKLKPYKGSQFKFEILIEPYALNNRVVERNQGAVTAIGGKPVWGTDGDLPKTQVKMVSAFVEGKKIKIDKALFNDLYECDITFDAYKNGDTYFVYQWNSDGAGAYQVVWVFTKQGLKQRLVGSMF